MDIARFLDRPTAIVGATGGGKTFTAKGAVEELLRLGRRVIVIDPTGAWYGLRAGADGSAEGGFPVLIFGGEHADIPITDEAGESIAEAIARRDVQAVIDTSEMTGGEKVRFLTAFLQKLYALNKAALHLVVDEADEVCPQNPMPDERRLSGAFDKIVRRGRIKGFRPMMITQRPAVLHKNVLSQIGTLIAMKLTSPQDRKAIEDWVKGNADADQARAVMQSLPTLKRGEGWVWSPADGVLERTTFPPIATYDSSRTPDADEAVVAPALTIVDVDALRDALRVANLPANEKGKSYAPSNADIEAAEKRGYDRGYQTGYHAARNALSLMYGHEVQSLAERILSNAGGAPEDIAVPVVSGGAGEKIVVVDHLGKPGSTMGKSKHPKPSTPNLQAAASTDGMSRLLAAMDTTPARRISWAAIAIRAGYAESGGGFRKAKKQLLESGRAIDGDGGPVAAKPGGAGRVPIRDELVTLWSGKLDTGATTLLGVLHRAGGVISISDLAAGGSYAESGGGFRKALKQLRSTGLVENAEQRSIAFSRAFLEAAGE